MPRWKWIDRSGHAQGIVIAAGGILLLPVMDAIAKYLATAEAMAPGQVAFYRFGFQFLLTVPVVFAVGGCGALRPRRWGLNLLRGALLGAASLCFFTAVKFMPLADSIAIFFVEPFILTVLSALVLRESVGWPRWLAIALGFLGALLVIKPSFTLFGAVALLPLGTATFFASYMLLNRALGSCDSPLVMQYVAGLGGSLFLGGALVAVGIGARLVNFAPSWPGSTTAWVLVLALGFLAAYSHVLIVWAFQKTPASILAPFQYLEIVSATLLGYLFFSDFPSVSKLLGIAIIVGSGLFIFWRERRAGGPGV